MEDFISVVLYIISFAIALYLIWWLYKTNRPDERRIIHIGRALGVLLIIGIVFGLAKSVIDWLF
jgi:hypothetical protein